MRPLACLLVIALFATGGIAMAAPARTMLYVSPTGSDAASGTKDAPFATLQRARDEVRSLKKAGKLTDGATVVLLGGP